MPPKSARSSVISVDPAVASHITGAATPTTSAAAAKVNAKRAGHIRTGSTPHHNTSGIPVLSKNHARTRSTPVHEHARKRSTSLKRAKNSTELLKTKAANASKIPKSPDPADVKRGRNFTITNVGTGGTLHLRPSPHQIPFSLPVSSPSPQPWASPIAATSFSPPPVNPTVIANTTRTRTRSASPKRVLGLSEGKQSPATRGIHTRSQSFSTIDESRKSMGLFKPKTLRIIINRPESVSSVEDVQQPLTLDSIAIPNYKLGRPRFSEHGTPFLRGSSYTRASGATSTDQTSQTDTHFAGPPAASLKALKKLQRSEISDGSIVPMPEPLRLAKPRFRPISIASSNPPPPLAPQVYDELAELYDDSSVVRYAENGTDISAASKIRIIAQISSESFMDYELVSDFFLTFRMYMTTFEVLDLLLARLKWAVGRLSDDGRIIRIRTFAALRHWILNYFTEDFVINRRLRVRFCQEVNQLYEDVHRRPKGAAGVSDLKILQDLKRCWNGRCSLYWDADEFSMDVNQERLLVPGGVIGSRNPDYTDMNDLYPLAASNYPVSFPVQQSPLLSPSSRGTKIIQHKRLPSSENAKKPASVVSDGSVHVHSCSLPRSKSRSNEADLPSQRYPQPVSVLARRQNAPDDLKVATHGKPEGKRYHSRGEGSVDSSRQQTPVEAIFESGQFVDPHVGSIIRGFVYGPVEPFVHLPTNPPLSPSLRFDIDDPATPRRNTPSPPNVGQNPAVKNIFGSIRRVLSGKQGANEVALITVSNPRLDSQRARTTSIKAARSQDDLRRRAAGLPGKAQLRIDLLCAAAVESFQTAVPGVAPSAVQVVDATRSAPLPAAPFSPPYSQPDETQLLVPAARLPSHITSQSGSILIVDDTAVELPVMSGALNHSYTHGSPNSSNSKLSEPSAHHTDHASFETQIAFRDDYAEPTSQDEGDASEGPGNEKSPSLQPPAEITSQIGKGVPSNGSAVTIRYRPTTGGTRGGHIRAQPSTQGSTRTTSPPPMTEATSSSESPVAHVPVQALRRRPGGDLRTNKNVHDLAPHQHHDSLDSMLDDNNSRAGSLLIMGKPTPPRAEPKKRISMINTHSSQHLRPSFEAAVSGFTSIPDDDDGGLEATLLKLEGRYEKKSPDLSNPSASPTTNSVVPSSELPVSASTERTDHDALQPGDHKQNHGLGMRGLSFLDDEDQEPTTNGTAILPRFAHKSPVFGLPAESIADSDEEEDGDAWPLQQRSAPHKPETVPIVTRPGQNLQPNDQVNPGVYKHGPPRKASSAKDKDGPGEIVRPGTSHTDGATSFLFDEDEDENSDLSSEISVDIVNYAEALGKPMSPMLAAPGTAISGLEMPSHPLTHASLVNFSVQPSPALQTRKSRATELPTPEPSPIMLQAANGARIAVARQPPSSNKVNDHGKTNITAGPAHVPFILACDSQVLAQQFTIVEQSALTEIEWTDLVEMRWNNKSMSICDWAEYMAKHEDARGIDLVITRFNLVVKWALSEIVLTQDINERARVISKLIHVAAHARRLRNYATMLQMTIALTSTDCTRLKKTWILVPGPDQSLLKNMEVLVQPIRNFHDLRVEMESTDLSEGCVPFIGLYVHDLTYNAQKPAEIEAEDAVEPLINFERFRTAAIIIKGLLRLIDASLRYEFEPIHGIIERCLWVSALTDDRIRALSTALEG